MDKATQSYLESDPIYAVIEARKRTSALWDEAARALSAYQETNRTADGDLPNNAIARGLEARSDSLGEEDWDAIRVLFTTQPTTHAGMIALLEYIIEAEVDDILTVRGDEHIPGHHRLFGTLIASLHKLARGQS
jgi:hypothetical protein